MSCITENTIVVKPDAVPTLLKDLDKAKADYRISGINMVYSDDKYAIYVFDCNGDMPWQIADKGVFALDFKDVYATETNYGEFRWTQTYTNGVGRDSHNWLITCMKNKLDDVSWKKVKKAIEYTW